MSRKIFNKISTKRPWVLLQRHNIIKQEKEKMEQNKTKPQLPENIFEFQKNPPEKENLPMVTCITPTYGRFNFLCEMVWCWQNQTYPNKELIIVNDQPNLVINSNLPNIKVFNFDERFIGLGAKRNFAVSQASPDTEFICPFDDDDLFFPEHISFLVEAFNSDPTIERTKNLKHWVSIDNNHHNISHDVGNTYFGASCFRKKIFEDYKLKDYLIMGEDADLFERKKLKMNIVENPLLSSFIHRRGMGIPHASGIRSFSYELEAQREIANSMQKGTQQYVEKTIVQLNPELTMGKNIYDRINEQRLAHLIAK